MGIGGEPPEKRCNVPVWAAAAKALGIAPERVAPFQFTVSDKGFDIKLAAYRAGVAAIKAGPGDFPVGWTLANADIQAGPGGEERAISVRREVNEHYLEAIRGDDFLGIQTYGRMVFGPDGLLQPDEGAELNMMGGEFYPEGLEATTQARRRSWSRGSRSATGWSSWRLRTKRRAGCSVRATSWAAPLSTS